jgi:hypothetical protein
MTGGYIGCASQVFCVRDKYNNKRENIMSDILFKATIKSLNHNEIKNIISTVWKLEKDIGTTENCLPSTLMNDRYKDFVKALDEQCPQWRWSSIIGYKFLVRLYKKDGFWRVASDSLVLLQEQFSNTEPVVPTVPVVSTVPVVPTTIVESTSFAKRSAASKKGHQTRKLNKDLKEQIQKTKEIIYLRGQNNPRQQKKCDEIISDMEKLTK